MIDLYFHKCNICGKEFYIPDPKEWAYKRNDSHGRKLYFCSYSCKRKWETEHGVRRGRSY